MRFARRWRRTNGWQFKNRRHCSPKAAKLEISGRPRRSDVSLATYLQGPVQIPNAAQSFFLRHARDYGFFATGAADFAAGFFAASAGAPMTVVEIIKSSLGQPLSK